MKRTLDEDLNASWRHDLSTHSEFHYQRFEGTRIIMVLPRRRLTKLSVSLYFSHTSTYTKYSFNRIYKVTKLCVFLNGHCPSIKGFSWQFLTINESENQKVTILTKLTHFCVKKGIFLTYMYVKLNINIFLCFKNINKCNFKSSKLRFSWCSFAMTIKKINFLCVKECQICCSGDWKIFKNLTKWLFWSGSIGGKEIQHS